MKRSFQRIYELVSSIQPLDPLEEEHITFTLNWIKCAPQIFRIEKPAIPNIHLVSYFVLIDQERTQILLGDHKKSGLWLPAGGHVELDEHPAETVKREAKEELSISANFMFEDPFFLTVAKTIGSHQHTDVSLWYLLIGSSRDTLNYDTTEFNQMNWFKPEDVPFLNSEPHMGRFLDKLNKVFTRSSYDAFAVEYANNTETLHPHMEASQFAKSLPSNAKILDIGCGPGRDAKIFEELGFNVTGVDFSPKMIELARKACKGEFYIMDIENLTFPNNTFDGIWASASFLHVAKKNLLFVFKKIHNLLQPNGVFYLSVKKGSGEMLQLDERYGKGQKFWSFFEEQELTYFLSEAQFELMQVYTSEKKSSYETHPMIQAFCKRK